MNGIDFLLKNAGVPIRYILTKDISLIPEYLANSEVIEWLRRFKTWAEQYEWCGIGGIAHGDVHGSDDRRLMNIIGKCFILGMNKDISEFDIIMKIYLSALEKQVNKQLPEGNPAFWKMYEYRDYETYMASYFPFMGYHDNESVRYIADKRINYVYEFTKQKRYDIYRSDAKYPGAKREWAAEIVDPALYSDGNIMLAEFYDYVLYAGIYNYVNEESRNKIETIVEWIYDEDYSQIGRYYYYVPTDPSYKTKSINGKLWFTDLASPHITGSKCGLLFQCFILSHFKASRNSIWFNEAIDFLNQYKLSDGLYQFPPDLILDKPDRHAWQGHLNAGENKKSKKYREIISTFWMERIFANLTE